MFMGSITFLYLWAHIFRTVVGNMCECVNSFTHLDYGLVNFTELWTHFGVPCTVCTLEIHRCLWAQLLSCICGLTFLELLWVIYASVLTVSRTLIMDSLISPSCGLTTAYLVLCVL